MSWDLAFQLWRWSSGHPLALRCPNSFEFLLRMACSWPATQRPPCLLRVALFPLSTIVRVHSTEDRLRDQRDRTCSLLRRTSSPSQVTEDSPAICLQAQR